MRHYTSTDSFSYKGNPCFVVRIPIGGHMPVVGDVVSINDTNYEVLQVSRFDDTEFGPSQDVLLSVKKF